MGAREALFHGGKAHLASVEGESAAPQSERPRYAGTEGHREDVGQQAEVAA